MTSRELTPFCGQVFIDGDYTYWKVTGIRHGESDDAVIVQLQFGRSLSDLRHVRVLGSEAFYALARDKDLVPVAVDQGG
jgi:hypothetical protein